MVHICRSRIRRFAIFVFSVAVAVPCVAEPIQLIGSDKWLKGDDGSRVALVVGGTKEVHEAEVTKPRTLDSGEGGSEGLVKLGDGTRGATVALSSLVPAVDEERKNNGATDRYSGGDDWYWYTYPASTLLLLWSAGLFDRTRTSFGDRHRKRFVKSNV